MEWGVNSAYKNSKDIDPKSMMDVALIPDIDQMDVGPSSSEKDKAASATKPRKKTITSVYLKFFETAPDGKSRWCKFCGQSYSIATATGNLGRHLGHRHPGYDKSDDIVANPVPQPIIVVKKSLAQVKAPQAELDHLNWLLIKWLILASLPPSTLEEKWLANSFKFVSPSVQIWPCEKFQAVLREVFSSMREDVKAVLDQVSSNFSVTLDLWTSYEQIIYMSVTCHWIDENWSFQKILLDICHIPWPCGSAEIYHTLAKTLRQYNIENRILSCTLDNTPNAGHACHDLKEDLDSNKLGSFCFLPCAARTLNLIINDGLRATNSFIPKIREFVLEMNSSSDISNDFRQFTEAYQEGTWKFPIDVSARWSGNYQMLDIVRKASKSIEAVIRKHEETLGTRMLLSTAENNAVCTMHAYLEPFHKTTTNICTNKMPTVGLVLFFMDHISEMIIACRESRHSPDWLKNAADDMASKARSYNGQVCNIFIYMSAILDPRIKVELIPESLNSKSYLEEARTHFIRNYSTAYSPSMSNGLGTNQEPENGASVSFAEEIARKKRRASMSSATDELTQYLSEPPAAIPTDVLEWWKVNSTRYPRLSVMARDFLAIQATSVPSENVFCGKGDEIDRQRVSISHENTQVMLCIKSWTEEGMKLRYKSSEVDYDRLMELAASAAENTSFNATGKKQK